MLAEVNKANLQAVCDTINEGSFFPWAALFLLPCPHVCFVSGKVVPIVDSVYEFEDVLEAYDRLMSDRSRGKLVIHVP